MKKLTNFFGFPLMILFVIPLLMCLIFLVLGYSLYLCSPIIQRVGMVVGTSLTFILLASLGLSVVYLVLGLVISFRKDAKEKTQGKKLVLRGVLGIIVTFTIFFLLSLTLSFFGLCYYSHPLPIIEGV